MNNKKLNLLTKICFIAVISGIFGFVYEVIFYYFNFGMDKIYWRGGNFLPWIDIYAIGSLLIYALTHKYLKKPLLVFLISFFSAGILEYLTGLGIYILFDGARYWDYNTEILNFLNIGGFVCFRSALFFGISGLILMYIIVPLIDKLSKIINPKIFIIIGISLFTVIMIDELYNLFFAKLVGLPASFDIYSQIGINYTKFN